MLNPVRHNAWPVDTLAFTVSTNVPYTTHRPLSAELQTQHHRRRSREPQASGAMGIYHVRRKFEDFVRMRCQLIAEQLDETAAASQLPVLPKMKYLGMSISFSLSFVDAVSLPKVGSPPRRWRRSGGNVRCFCRRRWRRFLSRMLCICFCGSPASSAACCSNRMTRLPLNCVFMNRLNHLLFVMLNLEIIRCSVASLRHASCGRSIVSIILCFSLFVVFSEIGFMQCFFC